MKELIVKILSRILSPKAFADLRYRYTFGHGIDWKHPRDLNEWINKLVFERDMKRWALLADKIAVRDWVKKQGFSEILIPVYGVWDRGEDIDWESLPDKFVLKTNHGCGTNIIVPDKNKADRKEIEATLNGWLKKTFGSESGETHYKHIRPQIYAEEFLQPGKQQSGASTLVDYKIWCINGEPLYIFTCSGRTEDTIIIDLYDPSWKRCSEYLIFEKEYKYDPTPLKRPECLPKMLEIARKLSAGEPQMRVDLYEIDGKPYFGELTLTSCSGKMNYFKPEWLKMMGEKIQL